MADSRDTKAGDGTRVQWIKDRGNYEAKCSKHGSLITTTSYQDMKEKLIKHCQKKHKGLSNFGLGSTY